MVEAFLETAKTEVTRSAIPLLIRHSRIPKCDLTSNLHPSLALAQLESNRRRILHVQVDAQEACQDSL